MIIIDFETYSPCDIGAGTVKYMNAPGADIVCMAYKRDDEPTRIWTPTSSPRDFGDEQVYAHGALFDFLAWNILGAKYGLAPLKLEQMVDTMALANRYTLPSGLDKAGEVLNLDVKKDKKGKALIKKISCPTKEGNRPIYGVDYTQQDYQNYLAYCKRDVDTTHALVSNLPASRLSDEEQYYWEMTQRMNLAGLPVDIEAVDKILDYITSYAKEMTLQVPILSNGRVEKVTQVKRLRDWMLILGVPTDNLTASTVEKMLLRDNLPDAVRRMLVLRQTIGRSSTAKYRKIKLMEIHERVYNNLHYYGAGTGRWAGRGFQMHNLPRDSVSDPDLHIDNFINFEPVDDPVNKAKALIRPMIQAPAGSLLIVSDYSSIENRILMWLANEIETLASIRANNDQYKEMAMYMYQTLLARVDSQQRLVGKIVVLGCGFQMGGARFKDTADTWGVNLTRAEADKAVVAFRKKHKRVVRMWKDYSTACIDAIRHPGTEYFVNKVYFKVVRCRAGNVWLTLTLPSGRKLLYKEPYLSMDSYGAAPGHWGTDPYTKKWSKLKLIPGRITENIVQALARDIMANGLRNIEREMPEVTLIGTVHDEALAEGPDSMNETTLDKFNECLCRLPAWAAELPLAAEGWIGERYRK